MITTKLTKQRDNIAASMRELNTKLGIDGVKNTFKIAKYYQERARARCPVRTGRLYESIGNPARDGIWETSQGGLRITVGTKVEYALALEMGIREPYIIKAKGGKTLKFTWAKMGGNIFFFKQVKHPRTRGKFFMRKAGIDVKANAKRIIGGR